MKNLFALTALAGAVIMSGCKEKNNAGENPFFTEWDTPFGVPPFDRIADAHYMPAFEEGMARHLAEIERISSSDEAPGFDNVILALDNSGGFLDRVSRTFFPLSAAVNSPEKQKIEERLVPLLAAHSDKITFNEALFAKVKAVYDDRAALGDSLKIRLTEKKYEQFVRAGALLDTAGKERLNKVNEELSSLTFQFSKNLLADNGSFQMLLDEADLDGLPESVKSAAAAAAETAGQRGKWLFTLDKPSLLPFVTYSTRRDLREKLYRGYLDRCNYGNETDNKAVIAKMVALRLEKAKLLGFDSWAAFVLDEQMAKTPANVYGLLDELWAPALASAKAELAEMQALMTADGIAGEFASWDWWYYAEKVRKQKYDLDEEMLRPYFALENVRTGAFNLANRLWGVTFRPVTVPLYHTEASAWEVLDKDLSHLGILYLDFHPRAGEKRGGAWFDEMRIQSYKDGVKVSPVTYIVCNFTRGVEGKPALLSLDETETFFHEFGHAIHHLFIDVPYRGLHDVERDFVVLPSQLLENWAFEPTVLRGYATHYSSETQIPDFLIEKIQHSALFNQGFMTTELLAAAIIDMDIHVLSDAASLDVNAFERESLSVGRGLIPQIEPRYRYPYFSHIFDNGYSAGYYGYLWAEVLDKDAFEAFRETGDVFNPDVAARLRTELLSRGGEAPGMALYTAFRGHEPSRQPLLRARGLVGEQ